MVSQELMEYISDLEKKKVRDDKTKEKLKNLIDKLDMLKISASFSYTQITKLKNDLEKDPIGDDLYNDSPFIPKLQSYFDSNTNFIVLMNEQTKLLSKFIEELIDQIDTTITDKLDVVGLKEIENKDVEKELSEIGNKKESEIIYTDSDDFLEEDEEITVSIQQFLFECLNENCGNKSAKSYIGGCRKCGKNIFKVSYL